MDPDENVALFTIGERRNGNLPYLDTGAEQDACQFVVCDVVKGFVAKVTEFSGALSLAELNGELERMACLPGSWRRCRGA
jgi:hypothetical protein